MICRLQAIHVVFRYMGYLPHKRNPPSGGAAASGAKGRKSVTGLSAHTLYTHPHTLSLSHSPSHTLALSRSLAGGAAASGAKGRKSVLGKCERDSESERVRV